MRSSIAAGLKLGEEAFNRLRFAGFSYESDGHVTMSRSTDNQVFEVFGETYSNFRDALDYASRAYRIPKSALKDLYSEHGNSFNNAINYIHKEMAQKEHDKNMKQLCGLFAKEHKQPLKFVKNTVQKFLDEDESLNIQDALNILLIRLTKRMN